MPRTWITGVGDSPRVGYDVLGETEKRRNAEAAPAVATPDNQPEAQAPDVFAQPVDTYLKDRVRGYLNDKVGLVNTFGTTTVPSNATSMVPPLTIHDTPETDVYWNDPGRLTRYYSAIQQAPPGWVPPVGIDPKAITAAYKAMEAANGYKPPSQWKPIAADNSAFQSIANMQLPTDDYLTPDEMQYRAKMLARPTSQVQEPINYANAPRWQQWLSHITPGQEAFKDAPGSATATSAVVSGLLAGLGGAGVTSIAIGAIGLLFGAGVVASGGALLAALPTIVGLGVGGMAMYSSVTGKETIPIVNDVLQAFDFLSIASEKGIGTGLQIADEGLKPFMDNSSKLKAAWKASEATYESSEVEVINVFAKVMDFIDFNTQYFQVDAENLAKPGESWNFDYGYSKPVKNENPEGVVGLNKLRETLIAMDARKATDQEMQDEVEKFKASFYSSGGNNDIVYGTLIDPANWMPFVTSKIGETVSRPFSKNLADSFRQSRGNLFIDSLPPGVQQLAMGISNSMGLKWRDSTGPISALSEYKLRSRYEAVTADNKSVAQMSQRERNVLNLDAKGRYNELQPTPEPRVGIVGRTLDLLDYLVNLTDDSKALAMFTMFHDSFTQVMQDPDMSREQKVDMLKKIAAILPADMTNVSERYVGSPAMLTIAEGMKYAIQNGSMDIIRSYDNASKTFIPWINDMARKLGTTVDDLYKAVEDPKKNKTLLKQLIALKLEEKDAKAILKKMKDNITGDVPVPVTEEHMWVQFSSHMYEKMREYLEKTYKLKQENDILRTAHIMKAAQNLMFLGFSPQYLYENFIGNKIAMASVGVLGYMRPNDIRNMLHEMGLDPARIGEGYTPGGDGSESYHLAGSQAKQNLDAQNRLIHNKRRGIGVEGKDGKERTDALGIASAKMSGVSKLGVMSTLSSKVEAADSMQAFTQGMLRFYHSEWKVDRGLNRAPLESVWEQKYPGITEYMYRAIEASKNMPQVRAKIFGALGKPSAHDVVNYAAKATGLDPDILATTFADTGITAEIEKGLEKATTIADVTRVFTDIEDTLSQRETDTFVRELTGLPKNTANKVKAEGIPAIMRAHTLMETGKMELMIAGKREWDDVFSLRNSGYYQPSEFVQRVRHQFAKERADWHDIYKKELFIAAGIAEAFGMEGEKSTAYLNSLEEIQTMWTIFHDERDNLLTHFFGEDKQQPFESKDDYKARRNEQWESLNDNLQMKYADVSLKEAKLAALSDQLYIEAYTAQTGWHPGVVKEWRAKIRSLKSELYAMQSEFRKSLKGLVGTDKDAAYAKFRPLINAKMNELDGIDQIFAARIMKGTPTTTTTNPIIHSVVTALQTNIETSKARTAGTEPLYNIMDVLATELAVLGMEPIDIAKMNEEQMYKAVQDGIPAKVLNMLEIAKDMNVATQTLIIDGMDLTGITLSEDSTNPSKLLNIVNNFLHLPKAGDDVVDGPQRLTTLRNVSMVDFIGALKEYKKRHKIASMLPLLKTKIFAADLATISDVVQREAAIHAYGMRTRTEFRAWLQETFKVNNTEVEAAIVTADARAMQWAQERGLGQTEAARDAFYATHFATGADTGGSGKVTLKQSGVSFDSSDLHDTVMQSIDTEAYKIQSDLSTMGPRVELAIDQHTIRESISVSEAIDKFDATFNADINSTSESFLNSKYRSILELLFDDISPYLPNSQLNSPYHLVGDDPAILNSRGEPSFFTGYSLHTDGDVEYLYVNSIAQDTEGVAVRKGNKVYVQTIFGIGVYDLDNSSAVSVYSKNGDLLGMHHHTIRAGGDSLNFVPSKALFSAIIKDAKDEVVNTRLLKKFNDGTELYIRDNKGQSIDIVSSLGTTKINYSQSGNNIQVVTDSGFARTLYADGRIEFASRPVVSTLFLKGVDGMMQKVNEFPEVPNYANEPGLVATHNIAVPLLLKAIENFGSIVEPSIGIYPYSTDGRFGSAYPGMVTIVFNQAGIEPSLTREVHAGDAYTQTMPNYNKIQTVVSDVSDMVGSQRLRAVLSGEMIDMLNKGKYGLPAKYKQPIQGQGDLYYYLINALMKTSNTKYTSRDAFITALDRGMSIDNPELLQHKAYLSARELFHESFFIPIGHQSAPGGLRVHMDQWLLHLVSMIHDKTNTFAPADIAWLRQEVVANKLFALDMTSDRRERLTETLAAHLSMDKAAISEVVDEFVQRVGNNLILFNSVQDILKHLSTGTTASETMAVFDAVMPVLDQGSSSRAQVIADVQAALVMLVSPEELSIVSNAIYDAATHTEFLYENNGDTLRGTSKDLIQATHSDSGHYFNDHEKGYTVFQDTYINALLQRHLLSMEDIHKVATETGFQKRKGPLPEAGKTFVNKIGPEFGPVIESDKSLNTLFRLDFVHLVGREAMNVDPTNIAGITTIIEDWLHRPLGATNGRYPLSPIDYISSSNVMAILVPEFQRLFMKSEAQTDRYFEVKDTGTPDLKNVSFVAFYTDIKQIDPTGTIQKWLADNHLDYVDNIDPSSVTDFTVEILKRNALFQGSTNKKNAAAKGETEFLADGRAIIRGLESPDVSTMMHELGHVFFSTLSYEEMNVTCKLGGIEHVREYYKLRTMFINDDKKMTVKQRNRYVNFEEWFARGWEMYITQGDAPTQELRITFSKFTDWMTKTYTRLKKVGTTAEGFGHYGAFRSQGKVIDLKVEVNGRSLKSIFDNMLAGSDAEKVPQYHELVQRAMEQIKVGSPDMPYRALLTAAQAKLTDMVFGFLKNQMGVSVEEFIAANDTVYLPDGTPVTGDLVKQIVEKGIVETKAIDVKLQKKEANVTQTFVSGQAIRFQSLAMVQQPAYKGGGAYLLNSGITIPGTGLWAVRIKGFEKDGTRYTVAVYSNGARVAFLPESFEGNMETKVGKKGAIVLGYDTKDQTHLVYKYGTVIHAIEVPKPPTLKQGPNDVIKSKRTKKSVTPQAVGDIPVDGFPEPMPIGSALKDLRREHLQPALSAMKRYSAENWNKGTDFKFGDVDTNTRTEIGKWLDSSVSADMGQVKRVASKFGEMRRDDSLINYQRRYGFDEILALGFPYEMWYTRTMINWAKRVLDRPAWYAMYARIEDQRRKFENIYLPNRLKGTLRLPAPWMPQWAGGSTYSDPFRRIFQFSSMAQPLQQFANIGSQTDYTTIDGLTEMVKTGEITNIQKQEAITLRDGPIWLKANEAAKAQADTDMNPLSMASMMLTPATWWTTPYYMGTGQKNKITTTPGYRTSQSIKELGTGTALQPITDAVGLLGAPEAAIREKVLDLDAPTTMFGQYGTYYINREIANMAIDSGISVEDANIAVAQKSGPVWDEAIKRVMYQQSLKTPMGLGFQSVKAGANPIEVIGAFVAGGFPNSIFPKGEQEYVKIKNQLSAAYTKKEGGDTEAIAKFYKDYPVYSLRTLIKESDPQEQMRMAMANQVWHKYGELGSANRRQARRFLGSEFDKFIGDTTNEYRDIVTVEQLAEWASGLGAKVPSSVPVPAQPASIPYFNKSEDTAYTVYSDWRKQTYPNSYKEADEYYALPEGSARTAYINSHPTYKAYLDANGRYKREHPNVASIQKEINSDGSWAELAANALNSSMKSQLHNFVIGKPLGQGTIDSLRRLYNRTGRDSNLSFEDWVQAVAAGINF